MLESPLSLSITKKTKQQTNKETNRKKQKQKQNKTKQKYDLIFQTFISNLKFSFIFFSENRHFKTEKTKVGQYDHIVQITEVSEKGRNLQSKQFNVDSDINAYVTGRFTKAQA